MRPAWCTRHAWRLLRARGWCTSARSHGKLSVDSVMQLICPVTRNHLAHIGHDKGRTSLKKVGLGGPYVQCHLDRHPETFGQTWALEWGGVDRNVSYCTTFVEIRMEKTGSSTYADIPRRRPDPGLLTSITGLSGDPRNVESLLL